MGWVTIDAVVRCPAEIQTATSRAIPFCTCDQSTAAVLQYCTDLALPGPPGSRPRCSWAASARCKLISTVLVRTCSGQTRRARQLPCRWRLLSLCRAMPVHGTTRAPQRCPPCTFAGVLLWEIITGLRPVRGNMRAVHVPAECPQEAADMIAACCALDPVQRPSARHLMKTLHAMLVRQREGHVCDFGC